MQSKLFKRISAGKTKQTKKPNRTKEPTKKSLVVLYIFVQYTLSAPMYMGSTVFSV